MKKTILIALCLFSGFIANAQHVIRIAPENGDMTKKIQAAIEQARSYNGKAVVIKLQNADYNLHRESSSQILYHISNTASEKENPDQTKHIGLWLKDLKNVTIDGQGARFVTHGEMTSFVIDQCENITLRDFTVTASDPTVPELTVTEVGENFMTVRIHPQSRYTVKDGHFAFVGDNLLRFVYDTPPQAKQGTVFQMRDGIRDQACGLIQYSKNVTLEGVHLAFLGNFGIVGQMTENITYRNLTFEPEAGSGRTCAGFADFVQMSGCKGKITIENSRFLGAHDDPINIHGTHLAVTGYPAPNQVSVKYMHPQTYGFQSFLPGNQIEFIDAHSLMSLAPAKVKKAEMKNEREILITLDRNIPQAIRDKKELVVENVTYTPEVLIRNNYFARIPTRGILVSTRRKVLIENNTFFRMQMSGILIADDARSWFESGMVRDVTIRNNNFMECGGPVILISPENDRNEGYVHRNIAITNNRFQLTGTNAIFAKSVDGLKITDNLFLSPTPAEISNLIKTQDCENVFMEGNIVQ